MIGNASGASAVNIQDGGNSITIDATTLPLPTGAATDATLAKLTITQGAATGSNTVALAGAVATTSAPTYTTGTINALSADTTGALRVTGSFTSTPSGTQDENLKQVNGNTVLTGNGVTGTGSQRVTISSDNTPFPVKTDQTTPGTTDRVTNNQDKINGVALLAGNGVTGTGSQRVTIASDNTPFVVVPAGANATAVHSATNPIWTKLTDGTNALGTAGNPIEVTFEGNSSGALADTGQLTSSSLAASGNVTLTATAVTTGTAKFLALTASSSIRMKVELQKFVSAAATTVRTFFVEANQSLDYRTPDRDSITFAGASGNLFQVKITNMDNVNAADVYASITQENI